MSLSSPRELVAMLLLAVSGIVFTFSGVTFTAPGRIASIFGVHLRTMQNHYIPPALGLAVFLAGLALLKITQSQSQAARLSEHKRRP